tara:strand:+ start:4918 stop:5427 length:510 start_codon:yes stop_codon:yes gene_type:complete
MSDEKISLDFDFPQVESQIEVDRESLVDQLWDERGYKGLESKVKDCIDEKLPEEIQSYVDHNYDFGDFVLNDELGNEFDNLVTDYLDDLLRLEPEQLCDVGTKFRKAVMNVVTSMEIERKKVQELSEESSDLTLSARDITLCQAVEREVLNIRQSLRDVVKLIGSEVQI